MTVTNQKAEVDEDEQNFDAHGPGAFAVSRRTFLTTQFHHALTSRLHSNVLLQQQRHLTSHRLKRNDTHRQTDSLITVSPLSCCIG